MAEHGHATPRLVWTPAEDDGSTGVLGKLTEGERQLDANVIALAAGACVAPHDGPEVDVLVTVLAGTGRLIIGESGSEAELELVPEAVAWLPRGTRRGFLAGPSGLRYVSAHQRRRALVLRAP